MDCCCSSPPQLPHNQPRSLVCVSGLLWGSRGRRNQFPSPMPLIILKCPGRLQIKHATEAGAMKSWARESSHLPSPKERGGGAVGVSPCWLQQIGSTQGEKGKPERKRGCSPHASWHDGPQMETGTGVTRHSTNELTHSKRGQGCKIKNKD